MSVRKNVNKLELDENKGKIAQNCILQYPNPTYEVWERGKEIMINTFSIKTNNNQFEYA